MRSIVYCPTLILAALAVLNASGCTNVQRFETLANQTCPADMKPVCPVDRPTLNDPRAALASGTCRCMFVR